MLAFVKLFMMAALVGLVQLFVLERTLMWEPGYTIQVAFLQVPGRTCSTGMQNFIRAVAPIWSQYANIRFEFIEGSMGEITVECNLGRPHTSAIGLDSRRFDASMNLGYTDQDLAVGPEYVAQTILHEFGHALGLRHEQANPYAPFFIDCNAQHVIDYALRSGANVEQFCRRYSWEDPNFVFSQFDPYSIMFYNLPEEIVGPEVANMNNVEISNVEQHFIGLLYPY